MFCVLINKVFSMYPEWFMWGHGWWWNHCTNANWLFVKRYKYPVSPSMHGALIQQRYSVNCSSLSHGQSGEIQSSNAVARVAKECKDAREDQKRSSDGKRTNRRICNNTSQMVWSWQEMMSSQPSFIFTMRTSLHLLWQWEMKHTTINYLTSEQTTWPFWTQHWLWRSWWRGWWRSKQYHLNEI